MKSQNLKKKVSFSKLKSYTKKVDPNFVFSKVNFSLIQIKEMSAPSFNNKIKISFYRLLKILKANKIKNFSSFYLLSQTLGYKLQSNGFYTSLSEISKKNRISVLKCKITILKKRQIVSNSFQRFVSSDFPLVENKVLKSLSKGFDKFERFYGDYAKTSERRQVFLKTLKTKRFFNKIFISRLFLYAAKGRKKYRNNFFYLFRRKRKVNSLFHVYTLSSLKFKEIKWQRKKVFKRLAWKIKKQKKWKRYGSFHMFRLRQKLSQVFYVPKHFEINYKTLTANYLGYTDLKTTNVRIPFFLNLRKLLTFLQ